MADNMTYDLWSDGYGASIHLLDDHDEYPVAGYASVLNEVYKSIHEAEGKKVLVAGVGTGIIAKKLYKEGYDIYGMEMSESLEEAEEDDMPNAHLICCDYSMGMPLNFVREEFDVAYSVYAFHHLDDREQKDLITDIYRHLKTGGKIIIAGLAFENMKTLKAFKKANKEKWLYEHMYIVYDEIKREFPEATWKQISKCAGVVEIVKE